MISIRQVKHRQALAILEANGEGFDTNIAEIVISDEQRCHSAVALDELCDDDGRVDAKPLALVR